MNVSCTKIGVQDANWPQDQRNLAKCGHWKRRSEELDMVVGE